MNFKHEIFFSVRYRHYNNYYFVLLCICVCVIYETKISQAWEKGVFIYELDYDKL